MKMFYIRFNKGMFINAFILFLLLILIYFLLVNDSVQVFNQLTDNPIYQGDTTKNHIAFACNVVWGTEYIADMLDVLEEHGITITFFIGGEWAKDNMEILKSIVEHKHEIGNHGYKHKKHSQLSVEENTEEIMKTERVIEEITSIKTSLFAPPYGDFNKQTVKTANDLDYKTIMWSIDTIDWRRDGKQAILDRTLKNPHNGAIILMHPTSDTVKALPELIVCLQELGYRITTVSETIG